MKRTPPLGASRRCRRPAALLGAAALAAGLIAFGNGAGASTTLWAPTATRAVRLLDGTVLGPLAARRAIEVSIVLRTRHPAELKRLAIGASTPGSADFAHFLTPKEVAARFAPSTTETAAVAAWLGRAGLRSVSVQADRLFIDATGTVRAIEKAFHTSLVRYRFAGRDLFENVKPALVPSRFGGEVLAVLGLSDMPMNLPLVVRHGPATISSLLAGQIKKVSALGQPDTSGFTPQQLAKIYDASGLPAAVRTSTAVIVSGNMTSTISDLRYAEAKNHAARAAVSVVYTAPKADVIYHNPYTGNLEWDLDTQMSTQIAGNVSHEYLYDIATLDDADVARAINLFVEQRRAIAGSASLGECDVQPFMDGSMVATDEVLEEGALQGQSFFASSGDNGYACPEIASTGVPGGVPGTSWPADGTWTTAVGGTSLLATSSGTYEEELSWIGGGGGVSAFETPGNWTSTADAAAAGAEFLPAGGRGVPDVSADADPNVSPVIVWQNKAASYVGGTSVSSPLVMGLWARMQTSHHDRLGVASIDFYRLYNAVNKTGSPPVGPAGFHDVVVGTNGLYTALPGYDYTTGIGSLEAGVLNKRVR